MFNSVIKTIAKCFSRLSSCTKFAFIPILCAVFGIKIATADAEGFVSAPSMLISLNIDWLNRNFIGPVGGVQYSGQYQTNGVICHVIDFSAIIVSVGVKATGYHDLGTAGHWANIGLAASALVTHNCGNIEIEGICNKETVITRNSSSLFENNSCAINAWPIFHFVAPLDPHLSNPFQIPANYVVTLDQPRQNSSTRLEFGQIVNGRWIPADKNKKVIPTIFGSMAGHSEQMASPSTSSIISIPNSKVLGFGISINDDKLRHVADEKEAQMVSDESLPFDNAYLIQIGISPLLFGHASQREQIKPHGLIGMMLPIKIYSTASVFGFSCDVEIILTGGRSAFGTSDADKSNVIVIQFEANNVKLCGIDVAGSRLIKNVVVNLILSAPIIDDSNNLTTSYKDSLFSIYTIFGPAVVSINLADAARSVAASLPKLGDIGNEMKIEFPDCIKVDNDGVVATEGCNEFGGKTDGFIKHTSGLTSRSARLNIAKAKYSVGTDGVYYIKIPGLIAK